MFASGYQSSDIASSGYGGVGGRPVEGLTEVRNNILGKAIARLGVQIPGVFYAGGLKCHRIIRVLQHGKDMSVFT